MKDRVPCSFCKGFIEHMPPDDYGDDIVHQCISCARYMPSDFVCGKLCLIDRLERNGNGSFRRTKRS
jgi:hypothetical protein